MDHESSKRALLSKDDYTVGWIAALHIELAAAQALLDEEHGEPSDFVKPSTDNNAYSWGRIGAHNVVVAALPAGIYGQVPAAVVAQNMVSSFPNIRVGLMVGIGGGIPQVEKEIDIRLGDVVVSQPSGRVGGVVQYDAGKATAVGFELKGSLSSPPAALLTAVTKLKAWHERQSSKVPEILQGMVSRNPMMAKARPGKPSYVYQGTEHDRLFRDACGHVGGKTCKTCDASQEIEREDRDTTDPEIHYGVIASGNAVIKHASDRAEVLRRLGDCLCVETEAAGLMNNFPCLVIRGICDYADAHKNDRWQPYAAATAAAYAKELLGVLDGGEIESSRRLIEVLDKTHQTVHQLSRGRYDDQVERWLSPADPSVNYNESLKKRHHGTGQWLLQDARYTSWKSEPSSFLWLNGIPGCGKTVLSSTVIQDLEADEAVHTVLYFYFTFTDTAKQGVEHAIRALINQIYHARGADIRQHLDKCFELHDKGKKQPSLDALRKTLDAMLRQAGGVWIVLDALDECPSKDRGRDVLLDWISNLHRLHENIHLLATSRSENDIYSSVTRWAKTDNIIELQSELVEKDIRSYIQWEVRNREGLRRWQTNPQVREDIESALTRKATGMFRWVFCQLEALEHCLDPPAVKRALDSLPDTLEETYRRILSNLPKPYLKYATRLLQFLAFAERPLRLDEAVDMLAVDITQKPRFNMENRMPEPLEITQYCGGLVIITERQLKHLDPDRYKTAKEMKLAHFSVQKYLTSEEVDDEVIKNIRATASATITEICVAYLLELDSLPAERLCTSYPLSRFAAQYWPSQAVGLIDYSDTMRQLLLELLTSTPKLQMSYQLYAPDELGGTVDSTSKECNGLYYACICGLNLCVQDLLNTNIDVNAQGGMYGNTLQAASGRGYLNIVNILLDKGANVNAQGGMYGNALQAASGRGRLNIVNILLDKGANVNAQGGRYDNALQAASVNGHLDIVRVLLKDTTLDI